MDTNTRKRSGIRRALACLLALALSCQIVWAGTADTLDALAVAVGAQPGALLSSEKVVPGDSISDWIALAAGRTGRDGAAYLQGLEAYATGKYAADGALDSARATEWHRIALTALALGGDPTDFGPRHINLIADGTYAWSQKDTLGFQGLNAWIYALLTLDSRCYAVPEEARYTRETILGSILAAQGEDGSFGLNPGFGSVDITAMALQALAPYQNSTVSYQLEDGRQADVHTAVDKALTWLESQCHSDTDGNSCPDAQVVLALCDLGRSPGPLRDTLERYRTGEGLYRYLPEDETFDLMATEQVLLAQIALERQEAGERRIFDFREEMDADTRARIDTFQETIANLDDASLDAQASALYEQYLAIPAAERSYAAFDRLRDALVRTGEEVQEDDPVQAYAITAPTEVRQSPAWLGIASAVGVVAVIAAVALLARKKGKKNG